MTITARKYYSYSSNEQRRDSENFAWSFMPKNSEANYSFECDDLEYDLGRQIC